MGTFRKFDFLCTNHTLGNLSRNILRDGGMLASLEELAFRRGWLSQRGRVAQRWRRCSGTRPAAPKG